MEIEKEIVREVARGDKPWLWKSADRKAQIRKAFVQFSGLICAFDLQIFSGKVYHPEPPHAQPLFLFPIVFGINIYLASLDADRSPNAVSVRAGTSQVDFEVDCPPRDLLITMVKETVILYKKESRKMKKSRISRWSERDENAKWLRDFLWLCQACKRGFSCRPM